MCTYDLGGISLKLTVKCLCPCNQCCDGCQRANKKVIIRICFPGDARVQLDNDRFIQRKDLRAGDRLLTGKLIDSDSEC